jgi:hypothetical protein
MNVTILYKISGTGWLNIKLDGKMIPVCKLTTKQLHDLQITLKELGLEQ